jgi:putative phosphoribosyl transferase
MVADKLHQRKLATLLFDLLTYEEVSSDSAGSNRFDIQLLTNRLVTVTRWAQQQELVGDLKIGYFGASTGAAAALAAAAMIPEIRAVVSRGGRTDLAGNAIEWVAAPTLLIVGELDFPVIEWNEESFKRMDCVKGIILVSGATHLFQEPNTLEEVAELAASWFERYLPVIQQEGTKNHENANQVTQNY